MDNSSANRKLTLASVLSSLALVLVILLRTFLFASAPFLEYDPADIPILIGTLTLGPLWGLAITIIVSGIQAMTVSAQSGVYGFIMHVISTGTLVTTVALLYKYLRIKDRIRLVIAVVIGTVIATSVMVGANLLITPFYMGIPVSAVVELLVPIIIPFNLIKLGANSVITMILFKAIEKYIVIPNRDR